MLPGSKRWGNFISYLLIEDGHYCDHVQRDFGITTKFNRAVVKNMFRFEPVMIAANGTYS
jgi:hypothetical protein